MGPSQWAFKDSFACLEFSPWIYIDPPSYFRLCAWPLTHAQTTESLKNCQHISSLSFEWKLIRSMYQTPDRCKFELSTRGLVWRGPQILPSKQLHSTNSLLYYVHQPCTQELQHILGESHSWNMYSPDFTTGTVNCFWCGSTDIKRRQFLPAVCSATTCKGTATHFWVKIIVKICIPKNVL